MTKLELISECIEWAQASLSEARKDLRNAISLAQMLACDDDEKIASLIKAEYAAIDLIDDRLGDIRTGRNL